MTSIQQYNIQTVKTTTCQTIQLHNLNCENLIAIHEQALEHGIICRGGGGDNPRNCLLYTSDIESKPEAHHILLELSESVSRRLRQAHSFAGMISVEIKYNTFETCLLYTSRCV